MTTKLAERAVSCKRWSWVPGMLLMPVDGHAPRLITLADCIEARDLRWRPDLDDPATLGCLLALVRAAWGDPTLTPVFRTASYMERHRLGDGPRWDVCPEFADAPCTGHSEAEALVAALEAAP